MAAARLPGFYFHDLRHTGPHVGAGIPRWALGEREPARVVHLPNDPARAISYSVQWYDHFVGRPTLAGERFGCYS